MAPLFSDMFNIIFIQVSVSFTSVVTGEARVYAYRRSDHGSVVRHGVLSHLI